MHECMCVLDLHSGCTAKGRRVLHAGYLCVCTVTSAFFLTACWLVWCLQERIITTIDTMAARPPTVPRPHTIAILGWREWQFKLPKSLAYKFAELKIQSHTALASLDCTWDLVELLLDGKPLRSASK